MAEDKEMQKLVAKACAYRLLTYMEGMAEDSMVELEEAELLAEWDMLDAVRNSIQNALAYLEDPEGYVEDNMPGQEAEE